MANLHAPSPCIVLVLTECSSLCLTALDPGTLWKIQGMSERMPYCYASYCLACE